MALIIDHIRNNNPDTPWVPWTKDPAALDQLEHELKTYALDPTFEQYGNFITPDPRCYRTDKLIHPEPGYVQFWGNFYEISSCFRFATNEPDLIARWTQLLRNNQNTPEYKFARAEVFPG